MEREDKKSVSIDCTGLIGEMGDGYVTGEDSGNLSIKIYKDKDVLRVYNLSIDLDNDTVELELDPVSPVVQEFVCACKRAYNTQDLKTAWKYWCAIYDKLEGAENTGTLFKVMRQFSDEQVYAITDYGKKLNGYA